jgi:hypothetical protein
VEGEVVRAVAADADAGGGEGDVGGAVRGGRGGAWYDAEGEEKEEEEEEEEEEGDDDDDDDDAEETREGLRLRVHPDGARADTVAVGAARAGRMVA